MKKEIKDKWIEALRSGKYEQAQGALQCDGGFCCLGVLSDLYAKEHSIEWTDSVTHPNNKRLLEESALLPNKVKEWAGLNLWNPIVNREKLSSLNDEGMSFKEIADLIEQQL